MLRWIGFGLSAAGPKLLPNRYRQDEVGGGSGMTTATFPVSAKEKHTQNSETAENVCRGLPISRCRHGNDRSPYGNGESWC